MSAIAGVVHFDGAPVDREDLQRMKSALAMLGTDRQHVWSDGEVGFVHCLFRTTPQADFERQPVSVPGGACLVTNGRIDNRDELFRRLGRSPDDDVPDSALLMAAWQRWGTDFANQLAGDFSCAVYERDARRLVLTEDHLGSRPVYYHWNGRTLTFASAPRALFALSDIPRRLSEDALLDWLLRSDLAPGATIYEQIAQVPPAHFLSVTTRGPVLSRYWAPDPGKRLTFKRREAYGEAFRELLGRVVRSQVVSTHPVGIMLSGGLDSQAIAATAAPMLQETRRKLYSFTLVPDDAAELPAIGRGHYASERTKVEDTATRHPNLVAEFLTPCRDNDLSFLQREFALRDGPIRETPTYLQGYRALFAAATNRGVRVLLNGSRGNHTLSYGGWGRLVELARRGRLLTLGREIAGLATFYDTSALTVVRNQLLPYVLPWRVTNVLRRRPAGPPWSDFSFVSPQAGRDLVARLRLRNNNKLFASTLGEWERRVARVCDRHQGFGTGSLFGGFEFRSPAADIRLIEFCLALPYEVYLRDGLDRRLLRTELADRLPERIRMDTRRGLQNVDWIERAVLLQPDFERALEGLGRHPIAGRLLDGARLERAVKGFDPAAHRASAAGWMTQRQGVHNTVAFFRFLDWFEGKNAP